MQVLPGEPQGMNEKFNESIVEGARFEALGCYLIVERLENKIIKVSFSAKEPSHTRSSELAERLIKFVTDGTPCPKVDLDLSGFDDFRRDVTSVVMNIPRGRTMTYGRVAALSGHPSAARAVGNVMAKNPFVILVPCHRVVAKQGLGGFAWGLEAKKRLLEFEASNLQTIFNL
jgi:methylated-DNA-[protein]-cysteine S-methyltransferase